MKSTRLKAVIITPGLLPRFGGSSISEASLCQALRQYCKVRVLCRKGLLDYDFAKGYGLYAVKQFTPMGVFLAWLFRFHWINHEIKDAQVVHINGHWKWENYFWARLCVRGKIPYVLHPRGMFLLGHRKVLLKRVFNGLIGNWIFKHAAKIVALSRFEIGQFKNQPIDETKIAVIPNGIFIPEQVQSSEGKLSVPSPFFLYLGRIEPRKNLIFLVEEFSAYRKNGGSASLLLMGPVERGYDKVVVKRLNQLGLKGQVSLYAAAYGLEKWAHLKAAKAVIYPTLEEPFGRVPFEAVLANTLPVIPAESGSAEYLKPFLPHCLYASQTPGSVAEILQHIDRNSESENLDRARTWVRQNLEWSKIAYRVSEIYDELTHQPE